MTRHELAVTEEEYEQLVKIKAQGNVATPMLTFHGKTSLGWGDMVNLTCGDRPHLEVTVAAKVQVLQSRQASTVRLSGPMTLHDTA